ncbi:hypothetical protein FVEN_g12761 [Fusarium venenatum]|nr:hypothetical protein FVEN_g12761 [Fusarium venenatum]
MEKKRIMYPNAADDGDIGEQSRADWHHFLVHRVAAQWHGP